MKFIFECFSVEIKKTELDGRKSLVNNIREMGLVYNVNKTFGMPSYKQHKTAINKKIVNGFVEEDAKYDGPEKYPKKFVAERLEGNAKELRASKFRISRNQVKILSHFLDKYQLDYKKMIKDPKNIDQWTWRQFRQKIRKFMSIPEQFAKYLEEKNFLDEDIEKKWQENNTDEDE